MDTPPPERNISELRIGGDIEDIIKGDKGICIRLRFETNIDEFKKRAESDGYSIENIPISFGTNNSGHFRGLLKNYIWRDEGWVTLTDAEVINLIYT